MSSFLEVDPRSLHSTATKYADIAAEVRRIFNDVNNSMETITSSAVWQGQSSKAYINSFSNLKTRLDLHISQLEELGPRTGQVATNYQDTDKENELAAKQLEGGDYRA